MEDRRYYLGRFDRGRLHQFNGRDVFYCSNRFSRNQIQHGDRFRDGVTEPGTATDVFGFLQEKQRAWMSFLYFLKNRSLQLKHVMN